MKVRAAIIDLYNDEQNQEMRCIHDLLSKANSRYSDKGGIDFNIYDARYKNEVPTSEYDIFISSGGPGSPFDGEGTKWENKYFKLLDNIISNNANRDRKKYVFFICHSFQIMARYFKLGDVIERRSKSFGIVPIHKTEIGKLDNILKGLPDIFYGADFRSYQVVNPNKKSFRELGAKLIAIEKIRPHVDLERAMMGIRISDEIIGTQFHPEADISSMEHHFMQPDRQKQVIDEYGEKKLKEMIDHIKNPDNITLTQDTVIPNFLDNAMSKLVKDN